MSRLVIDTSVIAKLLFPEPHSDKAAHLIADADAVAWRILAPLLLPAETTNVIRRRMRRERLSLSDALVRSTTSSPCRSCWSAARACTGRRYG